MKARFAFAKKIMALQHVHWTSIVSVICMERDCKSCEFKIETGQPCKPAYMLMWADKVVKGQQ